MSVGIDLNLSGDQREILDALRKLLAERFPVARLRASDSTDTDHAPLAALVDFGLYGLGCPESAGGAGFSILEDTLAFVELGRHLVTPHALAATLAVRMALALGQDELAGDILCGRRRVCIANALAPFDVDHPGGAEVHLLDAERADLALLWSDAGMLLLRRGLLASRPLQGTDRSLPLQRSTLAEAAVLARLPAAQAALPRLAHLLLSAMLLGMAEATRDMAVDYAKVRRQFGQPIGAFQAVKHRCANMAIGAEALRAQLVFGAIAERDQWPDAAFQNDACRILATRCALANAAANIQIHGGMGFTAECDAHLYLLRAHLYEHLGGPSRLARARLSGMASAGLSLQPTRTP